MDCHKPKEVSTVAATCQHQVYVPHSTNEPARLPRSLEHSSTKAAELISYDI